MIGSEGKKKKTGLKSNVEKRKTHRRCKSEVNLLSCLIET